MKTYIVTPHLNHLTAAVLMSGHNVCFCDEIKNIIPELSYLDL